jgi:hypothetical protein
MGSSSPWLDRRDSGGLFPMTMWCDPKDAPTGDRT